jgi:hypothetical protein
MFDFISKLISPVTNIVDKMVMDKDKFAELQFKKTELNYKLKEQLLGTTTSPNTDAFVKLLLAFRDIVLPMLRPLGSACMTGFVIYAEMNDIALSGATEAIMAAAFPGWMTSRHMNKGK